MPSAALQKLFARVTRSLPSIVNKGNQRRNRTLNQEVGLSGEAKRKPGGLAAGTPRLALVRRLGGEEVPGNLFAMDHLRFFAVAQKFGSL